MTYNNEEDSLPVLIYLKQMFVAINASENYRDFGYTPKNLPKISFPGPTAGGLTRAVWYSSYPPCE